MRLDHILVAVTDLVGAAAQFEAKHGLRSTVGGRHPDWGTENRIVALGDSYLELVAVTDTQSGTASRFGRWVAAGATSTGRFIGWAVRPPDLDATAARLGLRIDGGTRTTPSGKRVVWRSAGIDEAIARPWLPFFIEWADMAMFPGRATARGAVLTQLAIEGDVDELSDWLGEHALPIDARDGELGVASVVLDGPSGRVVLES